MSFQLIGSDPDQPEQLTFTATEKEFNEFLESSSGLVKALKAGDDDDAEMVSDDTIGGDDWHLLHSSETASANYSIVSIMGAQSTGKSTVLNRTFGTGFRELDARAGFGQTTLGIWLGDSPKANDVLVMDLEGSDSAQREKNRENFERQVSLMALTLAEVLIINIKANEMGRASGMQLHTLKAIFEANMRLFNPKAKTLLLYLFRFYIPDERSPVYTPPEVLIAQMKTSIERVWDEVEKPESFSRTRFSDMFDLDFYFLPDFAYYPDKFDDAVDEFRSRFSDKSNPKYYFNTSYHCRKSPMLSDLWMWSRQVWDVVVADEELNIPDQRKMLSAFRCEAAAKEAMEGFSTVVQVLKQKQATNGGCIGDLGEKLNEPISVALEHYKTQAHKYDAEEYENHLQKLIKEMENDALRLFEREKAFIQKTAVENFRITLKKQLPVGKCSDNFRGVVEQIVESLRSDWHTEIKRATINTDNKEFLNKTLFWSDVAQVIDESLREARIEQFTELTREFQTLLGDELSGPMARIFRNIDRHSERVWNLVSELRLKFYASSLDESSVITSKLNNLMFEETVTELRKLELHRSIDKTIIEKCTHFGSRMQHYLMQVFDEAFKKTDEGVPRDWRDADVEGIFKEAKAKTVSLIDGVFRNFLLYGDEKIGVAPIDNAIVSEEEIIDAMDALNSHCDSEYTAAIESKRRLEFGGSILPTHPLQWVVLLLLGWNELWSLATNPLWLLTVLFGGAIAFVVWQAHAMGMDVQSMAWSMFGKLFNQVLKKLETFQDSHRDAVERRIGRTPESMKRKARTAGGDDVDISSSRETIGRYPEKSSKFD